MKNIFIILFFCLILVGCTSNDFFDNSNSLDNESEFELVGDTIKSAGAEAGSVAPESVSKGKEWSSETTHTTVDKNTYYDGDSVHTTEDIHSESSEGYFKAGIDSKNIVKDSADMVGDAVSLFGNNQ